MMLPEWMIQFIDGILIILWTIALFVSDERVEEPERRQTTDKPPLHVYEL